MPLVSFDDMLASVVVAVHSLRDIFVPWYDSSVKEEEEEVGGIRMKKCEQTVYAASK